MVTILITILKETLFALIGKIAFRAIFERTLTRAMIWCAEKLEARFDNDITKGFAQDMIKQLKGKKLHVIDNEHN